MPRPRKTETELADMRARILDAAYQVLLERGYQGLSARAIAEKLGVAHMALYTYFPNQAAILQALAEREMAAIHAQQECFERRAESEDIVHVVRGRAGILPRVRAETSAGLRASLGAAAAARGGSGARPAARRLHRQAHGAADRHRH